MASWKRMTATLVLCLLAGEALAQSADGNWRCSMIGDIPIGILTISGSSYQFQSTNVSWEPNDNPANGSGSLGFDGAYLWPESGPLKDSFGVTGMFSDRFINWNNNDGTLMGCRN
jgi:hypothetical protein